MKRLFKFRYPKLGLLILFAILAYFIFSNSKVDLFVKNLESLSYLGMFIAGMLFSFGFTTPFAIGFFIILNPSNIFLAAIVGGIGALISDLVIFKIIRYSFMDEFNRLEKTKPLKEMSLLIKNHLPTKIKTYLLFAFAGLIIASPLPDEVGVTMLAGLSHISTRTIGIVSFIGNSLGILVMLLI